jgi:hypothetical protein
MVLAQTPNRKENSVNYTGSIEEAILVMIIESPNIRFIFGKVINDRRGRFRPGFWIATSNLIELSKVDNGFAAVTQNSIYLIEDFEEKVVPWEAIGDIRMGTHPDVAVRLLEGDSVKQQYKN